MTWQDVYHYLKTRNKWYLAPILVCLKIIRPGVRKYEN